MGNTVQKVVVSDPFPKSDVNPAYDSHFGFPAQRKKRVSVLSEEDMIAARVPKRIRDYCAHLYLEVEKCQAREFPILSRCATEKHRYYKCEYDDFVLRMKEYERERRLLIREKRRQQLEATAA